MKDDFIIYIDRLKDGQVEKIDLELSPVFMEIHEKDLAFNDTVQIEGSFYTTPDHLIGNLQVNTNLMMPCSICDETFSIPICVDNYYITEPLENIPSGLYYPQDGIREAILLETPSFYECNNGQCPCRKELATILGQKNKTEEKAEQKCHLPFKDLE